MMKRLKALLFIGYMAALFAGHQTTVSAQLLNEIEIDPPSISNDACQYVEVLGTAGSTVPANTYFLSVNSDAGNFGFANQAVNLGGRSYGTNGIILLINTSFGDCPNRNYGTGATRVDYFNPLRIGSGSETYLIVTSTVPLSSGQDLDVNNDGNFDAGFGITVLDGFALIVNPEEEWVYGSSVGVTNISNVTTLDQPDAVTRFPGNTSPFLPGAFYLGELAASPDETTVYAAPFSANFPNGGALTPGQPNSPSVSNASIGGRVTTPSLAALRNALVILTDAQGNRRTATTSSFGIYSFSNVATGGTYVISISSKRYRFAARTLTVTGDLTDIDFVGLE